MNSVKPGGNEHGSGPVEVPVTDNQDKKPAEKPAEKPADKPAEKPKEKPAEKPKETTAAKPFPDSVYTNPRVAIVTFVTGEHSYTQTSLLNKAEYARRHNYTLFVDFDATEPRGVMWYKFTMVERIILGKSAVQGHGIGGFPKQDQPEFDWIWWIDFDTLFMNMKLPLGEHIKNELASLPNRDEVDMLFTPDCLPLNAGSMVFRAHPRVLPFFNLARAYSDENPKLVEQDVLRDLMFGGDPGWQYDGLPKLAQYAHWHPESAEEQNKNRTDSPAFIHLDTTKDQFPQHVRQNKGKFPKTGLGAVTYASTDTAKDTLKPDENVPDAGTPSDQEFRYPSGKRARFIKQSMINVYPPEIPCNDRRENRSLQKGDLMVHFAGAWAHLTTEKDATGLLMRRYAPQVER